MEKNKKAWDSKLELSLQADRVTMKKATSYSPFGLVYGLEARLPQNNVLKMYKFAQEYDEEICDDMQHRINNLVQLDESRREAQVKNLKMQLQVKHLYDRKDSPKKFEVNNMVLTQNARAQDKGKHGKFESLWMSPYLIVNNHEEDSYFLQSLTGEIFELPVHGQFLNPYFS